MIGEIEESDGRPTISIVYTSGVEVQAPDWVVNYRGHDLLPIAQTAFGGFKLINPPRLLKALQRTRLIPLDLADLLARVQKA